MRILFVFTEINQKFGVYGYQHGIASISAVLKNKGYNLIDICHIYSKYKPILFLKKVKLFNILWMQQLMPKF